MPLPTMGAFPPVVTPAVTPGLTPLVSLWKTLSLCILNFYEIDTPTYHGSFPPVVTPAVTPMVSLWLTLSLCKLNFLYSIWG